MALIFRSQFLGQINPSSWLGFAYWSQASRVGGIAISRLRSVFAFTLLIKIVSASRSTSDHSRRFISAGRTPAKSMMQTAQRASLAFTLISDGMPVSWLRSRQL